MNSAPAPKRRFQYSLGTLIFGVIAIGACLRMYFIHRENTRLRAENHAYRDELGVLNIDDPEKAWIREMPSDMDRRYKWRFRIYVPKNGIYRIGIQDQNVTASGIDVNFASYTNVDLRRGESSLEFNPDESNAQMTVDCHIDECNRTHSLSWTHYCKDPGPSFERVLSQSTILDFRNLLVFHSTAFDPAKPIMLVAYKAMKKLRKNPATSEPAPGLLIWFEQESK